MAVRVLTGHTAEECPLHHAAAVEVDRGDRGGRRVTTEVTDGDAVEEVGHHHHVCILEESSGGRVTGAPGPT
jgi:hypothetical protein